MNSARESIIREAWRSHRSTILERLNQGTGYAALHHRTHYLVFTMKVDEQHGCVVASLQCEGVTLVMGPLIHR